MADGDLGREHLAVLAQTPGFTRCKIRQCIPGCRGQALQRRGYAFVLGNQRKQQIDPPSEDLGCIEAEHALAGGIESADRAVLVDGEYHILDVIKNDLQVLGTLLTRLTRHGARLVGHEAH
jgi:hypothetical protein